MNPPGTQEAASARLHLPGRRALRINVPPAAGFVVAAAAVALVVAWVIPALPSSELSIRVDLYASTGDSVVLYLNDQSDPPQIARLAPGSRTTYEFEAGDGNIERIRVDVGDRPGADIRFFDVDVLEDDGEVAAHFGPPELATWARYSASAPIPDPEALHITSKGNRASVDAFVPVQAPSSLPWPLQPVVDELEDDRGRLRTGLLLIALGAAGLAIAVPRGRWAVALGAATSVVGIALIEVIVRNPEGIEEGSDALGRSTYIGLSLPTNLRAIRAAYALAVVAGLAAALLWRWRVRRRHAPGGSVQVHASRPAALRPRRLPLLVAAAATLAALGVLVPDLHAIVRDTIATQHPTGWDVENLIAWNAFSAGGLVPMDDFWYPYGNWDVFSRSLLTGPALFAGYQLLLLGFFWWVFWVASGRRVVAASFAALGLLLAQPIVGEFPRYGLPLAVALTYSCIDPDDDRRRTRPARAVFWLATTLALFLDPILVAYAAAGVALLLVVDLVRGFRRGLGWWARRFAADFGIPAAAFLVWLGVVIARDQLDGMIDLYTTLSASAAYSAEPTPFWAGARSSLELTMLVIWAPAALVAVGVFARLSERGERLGQGLAGRLLITGGVAFPLLHKHVVRPIPTQLFLFLVVAAILVLLWANAQRPASKVVGALAGLGLAVVVAFPGPEQARDGVVDLPGRVAGALELVVTDRDEIDRANASRFSVARFENYRDELAVAADLRPRFDPSSDRNVYVLGDAPMLYVLLGQRPPWHITVYDTSPLDEQRRELEWLNEHEPRFVVLDRTTQKFDGVPHHIRIPLVFQHAIENYVLDHSVGLMDVLRRRRDGEGVDRKYWASALSNELDLGYIPNVSSYDDLRPCARTRAQDCGRFLRLRAVREGISGPVDVGVRFGRQVVHLQFTADDRVEYTLPLARTWPWSLSNEPELVGPPPAGWTVQIVSGAQPDDVLY